MSDILNDLESAAEASIRAVQPDGSPDFSALCELGYNFGWLHGASAREIKRLLARVAELEAEVEALRDKAIRFDLDAIGIASRERSDVELVELRAEVAALRRLLSQSRKWVRAELGEFEMFVKRPGMVPEAYRFGGDRITELDALLCEIDAALKEQSGE